MITKEKLEEWKRLESAATPGPWFVVKHNRQAKLHFETDKWLTNGFTVSPEKDRTGWQTDSGQQSYGVSQENAEFLAASRTAIPELIAEVERLNEEIESMKWDWVEAEEKRDL